MATEDYLIQYVLVRGDLAKNLKWPLGAVIAQACHACVAAIHLFQQDPHTQAYLNDLNNMHKAVLEVSSFLKYEFCNISLCGDHAWFTYSANLLQILILTLRMSDNHNRMV